VHFVILHHLRLLCFSQYFWISAIIKIWQAQLAVHSVNGRWRQESWAGTQAHDGGGHLGLAALAVQQTTVAATKWRLSLTSTECDGWKLKLPHNVDNKLSTRPSVASVACSLHCWTDDRTARSHTAKVMAPMCPSFALQGAGHYHHHHDLWRLAAAAAQGPHAVQLGMGREHNVLSSLDRWLLKLTNQQFNVSFGSTAFLWHISAWKVRAKLGTSLNPGDIAPSPP